MQLVMFGMGTQMSLRDLAGLGHMTYGVIIGVVLQFTIMPLVGYALAVGFGFPPEIAAGIVLIGSCSSGLASNVMSYLAKANLTLSVTLTAVGTLTAPLTTPLWMKLLAGRMVPVDFVGMMLDIIKLVIVPIGAALLHDYLKHASPRGRRIVLIAAAAGVVWLVALAAGGWNCAAAHMERQRARSVRADRLSVGRGDRRRRVSLPGAAVSGAGAQHAARFDVRHHLLHRRHHRRRSRRPARNGLAAAHRVDPAQPGRPDARLLAQPRVRSRRNVRANGRARSRIPKRRHGVGPGRQDGNARHRRPRAGRVQPVAEFRRLDPGQLLAPPCRRRIETTTLDDGSHASRLRSDLEQDPCKSAAPAIPSSAPSDRGR